MKRYRAQSGFTLIEVTVSLALMALMATLLVNAIQIGGHCWQKVTSVTAVIDENDLAQQFLREHLTSLIYSSEDPAIRRAALVGSSNEATFMSFAPTAQALGSRSYHVFLDSSSHAVLVSIGDPYSDTSSTSAPITERIISDVAELELQFYSAKDSQWLHTWDSPAPPSLIRIEVKFLAKSKKDWFPLYIHPFVDTAMDCQFDVVRRRCRTLS